MNCGVPKAGSQVVTLAEAFESPLHPNQFIMPYKDPERQREYNRAYYARTQTKRLERIKFYRTKRFAEIRRMKEASPCADCGESYPYYVMDYDHRADEDKKFGIGVAMRTTGWQQILLEIQKCDLVCSNCHRIRTYNRSQNT